MVVVEVVEVRVTETAHVPLPPRHDIARYQFFLLSLFLFSFWLSPQLTSAYSIGQSMRHRKNAPNMMGASMDGRSHSHATRAKHNGPGIP